MGTTDLIRSKRLDARVTPEEKQVIETAAPACEAFQ